MKDNSNDIKQAEELFDFIKNSPSCYHVIANLKNMLNEHNFEICSLKDENIDIDVVEDGSTFEENALKKASEIYKYLLTNNKGDALVLADDSGLEIDYLNGEPGIYVVY